ncbi:28S ribosomal protein S35, mitochondrial isoform X2 [Ischnura elegans]|uniref:28S ribosomal protein S35, mitochondrial isoform X2 n=1 Tax=Ischnura elegans TaxID=197161 RepID=UPI001ED895E9|nr:28S ribosomal protein S35, mitochondrial isoform X2 [Ischnura elegans]
MVFKASSGIAILHNCKYLFALPPPVRQASHAVGQEVDTDEFRVLDLKLKKKTQTVRRTQRKLTALSPRSEKMHVDQHWPSVWPGPRTFHPATVPLPLHQGYPHKKKSTPGKFANTELMKIPNFLHLTPPAIKQQCEALKKFCTDWPKGLETDEQQESHRPIEVSTSTYCHSSPSIRDPLSRIVTVKKVEPWESEKLREDMEVYLWEGSESEQNFSNLLQWKGKNDKENPKSNISKEDKENYKIAVESLFNSGEDAVTINKYKEATKNLVCLVLK